MSAIIWHNPRCSKSRDTLALLEAEGLDIDIRRYLEDAPSEAEIRDALDKLDRPPSGIVRSGEKVFREMGLSKTSAPDLLIAAMAEHPILIERPIVFAGGKAAIGRPPRQVLDLF